MLLFEPLVWKLSLLAGLLGLDATAALQVMISRPLVAGFLAGVLAGHPVEGLAIGCLLELLYSGMLPVGAYVPPDFTLAATVAAGGAFVLSHGPEPLRISFEAVLVALILAALPLAWAGGHAEAALRRLNVKLAHWADDRVQVGKPHALGRVVALALLLQFLRGAVLAFAALGLVLPLLGRLLDSLPQPLVQGLERMQWLLLALGLAVAADSFWNRRLAPLLAASFGLSWLLVHLLAVPLMWMIPLVLAGGTAAALTQRPGQA